MSIEIKPETALAATSDEAASAATVAVKDETTSTRDATDSTTATAPAAEDDDEEEQEESDPTVLLATGTKALALKQLPAACDALSRAVQLLSERHGEMAEETVEPLILYGKALLANSIATSAVLGGKAQDEKVKGADEIPAASGSGSTSAASAAPLTAQNINFHFGDSPPGSPEPSENGDEDDDEEAADDAEDDLENAFLMFDTARAILMKKEGEKESDLKRAEVHRLLGDVAVESEQFHDAQTEYQTSLDILIPILPPTDRVLSENHLLLALALDFVPNQTQAAIKHAEMAMDVLKKRKALPEISEAEKKDIEELLVDLANKIEDFVAIAEEPKDTAAAQAFDAVLAANAPVNNLNNLVKKKKRPAAAVEPEQAESGGEKKAKTHA